ncbi:SMI1/KNR4 family protein [Streptomyces cadmiisoli]|uniref:hypothetical protein n=1 Tax=Streptomyces cadmiisoli TaxID=2184053 RepID=UPI003669039E
MAESRSTQRRCLMVGWSMCRESSRRPSPSSERCSVLSSHEPDIGEPSPLPGILTVTVEGDMFDDCPDLSVGYVREPDRIQIRYLAAVASHEPAAPTAAEDRGQEQGRPADLPEKAVTVREVADAWHRITRWLQQHAPDSYAALRAGASPADIAALESDLGMEIPTELRVLWLLTAGDDGGNGWGCLPGNRALMAVNAVAAVYWMKMDAQANLDTHNVGRPEEEQIIVWKPMWIPVIALSPADSTYGLYLDAATGYLGSWSRFNDAFGEKLDTLVTYLEEAADMLENPALAADMPGLIGRALVWRSSIDPAREDQWQPMAS